jgi:hypothetical protein
MVVTVQLPLGANVMFDSPMVLPPATPVAAVKAAVDPDVQLSVNEAGVVLTRPAGKVSRNTAPARVTVVVVFGFAMVIETCEFSFRFIDDGVNDFAMVGAATTV